MPNKILRSIKPMGSRCTVHRGIIRLYPHTAQTTHEANATVYRYHLPFLSLPWPEELNEPPNSPNQTLVLYTSGTLRSTLYNLDSHLPSGEAVQDLYSTDAQHKRTWAGLCRLLLRSKPATRSIDDAHQSCILPETFRPSSGNSIACPMFGTLCAQPRDSISWL